MNDACLVDSNYEQAVNILRKVSGKVDFVIDPYVDPLAEQSEEEEEEEVEEEEEEVEEVINLQAIELPTVSTTEKEESVNSAVPTVQVSEPVRGIYWLFRLRPP